MIYIIETYVGFTTGKITKYEFKSKQFNIVINRTNYKLSMKVIHH